MKPFQITQTLQETIPNGYGLYRETLLPPVRTCVRMPFHLPMRIWWVFYSWVRTPFPKYKRELDIRDQQLVYAYVAIKQNRKVIKQIIKQYENHQIGSRRCIYAISEWVDRLTKEFEPEETSQATPSVKSGGK